MVYFLPSTAGDSDAHLGLEAIVPTSSLKSPLVLALLQMAGGDSQSGASKGSSVSLRLPGSIPEDSELTTQAQRTPESCLAKDPRYCPPSRL